MCPCDIAQSEPSGARLSRSGEMCGLLLPAPDQGTGIAIVESRPPVINTSLAGVVASLGFAGTCPSGVGTGMGRRLPMINAMATQRSRTYSRVLRLARLIRLSSGMPWNWGERRQVLYRLARDPQRHVSRGRDLLPVGHHFLLPSSKPGSGELMETKFPCPSRVVWNRSLVRPAISLFSSRTTAVVSSVANIVLFEQFIFAST